MAILPSSSGSTPVSSKSASEFVCASGPTLGSRPLHFGRAERALLVSAPGPCLALTIACRRLLAQEGPMERKPVLHRGRQDRRPGERSSRAAAATLASARYMSTSFYGASDADGSAAARPGRRHQRLPSRDGGKARGHLPHQHPGNHHVCEQGKPGGMGACASPP